MYITGLGFVLVVLISKTVTTFELVSLSITIIIIAFRIYTKDYTVFTRCRKKQKNKKEIPI